MHFVRQAGTYNFLGMRKIQNSYTIIILSLQSLVHTYYQNLNYLTLFFLKKRINQQKRFFQELPVIEYQMQQVRLFPYLAAAFVHHHFSRDFFNDFFNFLRAGLSKEDPGIIQSIFILHQYLQ